MTRRDEIFEVLCDYAKAHLGNSPSLRDLLLEMHERKYKMTLSTLRDHMTKLEAEGRVKRKHGKLLIIRSDWLPPEEIAEVLPDVQLS